MAAWEDALPAQPAVAHARSSTVDDISTGGERELPMKDGSMLALGYAPTKHTVKFTAKTDLQNITAVRLELLTDPNLPDGGPGRSIKGTGALTEFRVEAAPPDDARKVQPRSKSPAPPPISICPRRRSRKSSTTKAASASRHRPDPVRHRRTRRYRLGHRRRARACAISRARPYSISKSRSTTPAAPSSTST